jgi:hypothetical protein
MREHPKCEFCKEVLERCAYELITGYCKYKKKSSEEGSIGKDIAHQTEEKHIDQVKDLMQHDQREDDQQAFDVLSDKQDQHQQDPDRDDDLIDEILDY